MRITFQRFGGLAPGLMNRAAPFEADLSAADEAEVRPLIPDAFFSLESSGPPKRAPDAFRYEISVEDGARSHRVTLSETDIPETMRPFIEWLQEKAGS